MRLQRYFWIVPILFLAMVFNYRAEDTPFTLSLDSTVVSLEAIVQDSSGHPLIQLTKDVFEIYEDGQKQEIKYFGAAETPRSIMLLFDVTGVMTSQAPFMVKGMNAFFANVRPQDRIAVGTIGPDMQTLMNFRKIEKGKPVDVKLPPEQMGSNIYESLDSAARRLSKEEGRKAIIAMTDGRETLMFNETRRLGYVAPLDEDLDFKKRLSTARKRGVPYYIIALDTDPRYIKDGDYEYAFFRNPTGYMRDPQYANGKRTKTIAEDYLAGVRLRLETLAEATGGRVIYPRSIEDVAGLYDQIGFEMGFSYSLGFSPRFANDGKRHSIEVKVMGEGRKVIQNRDSYGVNSGK